MNHRQKQYLAAKALWLAASVLIGGMVGCATKPVNPDPVNTMPVRVAATQAVEHDTNGEAYIDSAMRKLRQ